MSNGGLARIKYFRGQMLTARDFDDQQEYHRQKQKHLLRRFPFGIVEGLDVTCDPKGSEPSDFDGFVIEEGLAIDRAGNEIVIPEGGHKIPVTDFDSNANYLSLVYSEDETLVGDAFCGSNQKNNRVKEGFKVEWDPGPNIGNHITLARIKLKDPDESGPICNNYIVITEAVDGSPRIRLDAGVVGEEQLADGAVTVNKIGNNAVTAQKIALGAVTEQKLAAGAVTDSRIAENAVTDSKIIDGAVFEGKLSNGVKGKLVPNGGAHNHTGGGGAPIPEDGLDTPVKNKLVPGGKDHDHTDENGAPIPENGLATQVKNKLVPGGKDHDHKNGNGALISEDALEGNLKNKLVTNGDRHTHTGGNDGAKISTQGLADNAVTEDKLSPEVKAKLNSVVLTRLARNTLDPGETIEVSKSNIPPNAIIQVVPISGALSWTHRMFASASSGSLEYRISIRNEHSDVTEFVIQSITFDNIVIRP